MTTTIHTTDTENNTRMCGYSWKNKKQHQNHHNLSPVRPVRTLQRIKRRLFLEQTKNQENTLLLAKVQRERIAVSTKTPATKKTGSAVSRYRHMPLVFNSYVTSVIR